MGVLRLKGSGSLDAIQIIGIQGGSLDESFLDEGFLLNKKPGMFQPQRVENAKILIANTPMDTDKIKVFGNRDVKNLPEEARDLYLVLQLFHVTEELMIPVCGE